MMEDELKKNAADLLALLKDGLDKGAQVAGEQLPDLAMQYVLWGRVYLTTTTLLALSLTAYAIYFANKQAKNEDNDPFIVWLFASTAIAVTTFPALMCLPETLMVWFAPKVWLLKEIAQVLK